MGKTKEVSNEIKKLIIKTVEKKKCRKISELYDVLKPGINHIIKRFNSAQNC